MTLHRPSHLSWSVVHGDCLDVLAGIEAGSVDSIVTSPPYADQRDYGKAAGGSSNRDSLAAFAAEFGPVMEQMRRVCSPTGSLMLNLGVVMRKGEEHDYADTILRDARDAGWKLLHRMVWHKPNSIPLSHAAYLHIKHEWVFWLAPTTDAYRGYDKDTRTPHAEGSVRRIGQPYMTNKDQRYERRGSTNELHPDGARPSTVFSAGVGSEKGVDHPAIMAMALALHLVSLSCPVNGIVLDPYCGSGTTGVAALRRGRAFMGIEREAKYVELARQRICDDAPLFNAGMEAVA